MRKATAVLVAISALVLATSSSALSPGSHASCSAAPAQAATGTTVVVSVTELPTFAPDYLIVSRPDGSSYFSGPFSGFGNAVAVDADGNSSSTVTLSEAGTWTFVYSGMLKDHGKYAYGTAATCTAEAT